MANLTFKDLRNMLDERMGQAGGKEALSHAPILFRFRRGDKSISNLFGIYMIVFGMVPCGYAFINLVDGELSFGFNPDYEIELLNAELSVHEWCMEQHLQTSRTPTKILSRQTAVPTINKVGRAIKHYLKGGIPFDPVTTLLGDVTRRSGKSKFNLVICGSMKQEELMKELADDLQGRAFEVVDLNITRPIKYRTLDQVQQRYIAAIAEADLVLIVHKSDRTIGESVSYEKNLAKMFNKVVYDLYEGGDTDELSVHSTDQAFTWFLQESLPEDELDAARVMVERYEEGLFQIIDRWMGTRGLFRTYEAVIGNIIERMDPLKQATKKIPDDNTTYF